MLCLAKGQNKIIKKKKNPPGLGESSILGKKNKRKKNWGIIELLRALFSIELVQLCYFSDSYIYKEYGE